VITVSKEDYLKSILEAEGEGQQVISATLAHRLSVSAPAVSMALRRLKRDSLVTVRVDGRVQLTPEGRQIARRLMVRHHLIERMLHEQFGMEWYKTHDEAERLEHAVSADFEAKLVAKLGAGGVCPHGNPVMPETAASRRKRGMQLLSTVDSGKNYRVRSTSERDRKLLEFLDKRGIRPGSTLRVIDRNCDETMVLDTDAGRVHLGKIAAEQVWVVNEKDGKRRD
jgi:DtxR family transcriptional regulator, Mn-dependent transcriptional regulator